LIALQSIPDVCDVWTVAGPEADADAPPQVLLEMPHGATRMRDLATAKTWTREYPEERYDKFFLANTDQGSAEYGARLAARLCDPAGARALGLPAAAALRAAKMKVLLVRALLPRTIVDVNRVWAPTLDFASANLTGVIGPFIREPADVAGIKARYDAYQGVVEGAYAAVCGAGGWGFNLHTYAPVSVSMVPGESIVETLERAYLPENLELIARLPELPAPDELSFFQKNPRRPEAQLITATPEGVYLGDAALAGALLKEYAAMGVAAAENVPFDLHPATTSAAICARYPGRVTVIELSRARLAERFDPFVEMTISAAKVEAMTTPIVRAFFAATQG
jgi:hypothetical protein